jgi:hypothetical protein
MPDQMTTDQAFEDIFDNLGEEDAPEPEEEEQEAEPEVKEEEPEEKEEKSEDEEEDDAEEDTEEDTDEDEDSDEEEALEEESEEKSEKDVDINVEELYNEWQDSPQKITIDGEELEVTPKQALEDYQRKEASDKRFREGAEAKKSAQTFWERILEDPGEALVDRIVDDYCEGDRVKARAAVVQTLLEWMEPEREAAAIDDEKEKELYYREHALKVKQQESERQENLRLTKAEREADAEFATNLNKELLKAFENNSLPTEGKESRPLWNRAGILLQAFKDELPSYVQGDVGAARREIVKNAQDIVKQIAAERDQVLKEYISTLSPDELEKRFPEKAKELKKERVEKAKAKRSTKKKGNVKKKQKTKPRKKEKSTSTEDFFGSLLDNIED